MNQTYHNQEKDTIQPKH